MKDNRGFSEFLDSLLMDIRQEVLQQNEKTRVRELVDSLLADVRQEILQIQNKKLGNSESKI